MNEPRLFLVRVWQHLSQFRAAVRGLDQDEPRLFHEAQQLGEFFLAASEAGSAAPAERTAGEPGEATSAFEPKKPESRP